MQIYILSYELEKKKNSQKEILLLEIKLLQTIMWVHPQSNKICAISLRDAISSFRSEAQIQPENSNLSRTAGQL